MAIFCFDVRSATALTSIGFMNSLIGGMDVRGSCLTGISARAHKERDGFPRLFPDYYPAKEQRLNRRIELTPPTKFIQSFFYPRLSVLACSDGDGIGDHEPPSRRQMLSSFCPLHSFCLERRTSERTDELFAGVLGAHHLNVWHP